MKKPDLIEGHASHLNLSEHSRRSSKKVVNWAAVCLQDWQCSSVNTCNMLVEVATLEESPEEQPKYPRGSAECGPSFNAGASLRT